MVEMLELQIGHRILNISTGLMAKQANGSVTVRYGDTVVLVTAVCEKEEKERGDFFPLTVNYMEKSYAAGKIPGGFFKREGRPGEKEILTGRLIDRPIRPLFPKDYFKETQIIAMVLSADQENDPDILSLIGASCALSISDIPFLGPVAAVRVGMIGGEFIVNPSYEQLGESKINIIVAGTKDAMTMVEGMAKEVSEETMLDAIFFGHGQLQPIIALQEELRQKIGLPKQDVQEKQIDDELVERVRGLVEPLLSEGILIPEKMARNQRLREIKENALAEFVSGAAEDKETELQVSSIIEELIKETARSFILEEKKRPDGRGWTDIRPIDCKVSVLPRTHGSALFTRGETQALAIATLGTPEDEKKIDDLLGERFKSFMLHYNFPPFSVGETKFLGSPGRREIGHGVLAERAIQAVIPLPEVFPYTIRIVADILESNGSSSMASVCGGALSLMDAGVPIKAPVAGIAMGLVKEGEEFAILSDIMGMEDHLGDMDFKVAGTRDGITAFQMDVKIAGVGKEIMAQALRQAREGRIHILDKMLEALASPRPNISKYAPKIMFVQVPKEKIGTVIGPGGKTIRGIIEQTEVKIDIDDEGRVTISSADEEKNNKARDMVLALIEEPEVGKIYDGEVKRICDFGAFIEILPGTDGLLHKTEISHKYFRRIEDEIKEGDIIKVKVIGIDSEGKVKLGRKELLPKPDPSDPDYRPPVSDERHHSYHDSHHRPPRNHRDGRHPEDRRPRRDDSRRGGDRH
ncbi:polyribonucleotide nucleotidyltransferase [bacterium]|nr:polyribonucleotide nucleotidyltransferase [bacterium]